MPLAAGTQLGPYEIIAPVGAGGMGEVYRARDPRLGREVAIKVLPGDFARDPGRVSRFEREAKVVAALNHPNIVVLHSIEAHEGVRFLTMELVEGESLDRQVAPGGLPISQVLEIGIAIAEALAAAHGKGVIHRDLKPANVMRTGDGRVKVLDFGLAKLTDPDSDSTSTQAATMAAPLSTAGEVMGTVPYMAPEQVRGEPVDARTDLFALGVLLYELAAGRRPFAGATAADVSSAILRDAPPPLTRVRSGLPNGLERIVGRCLEKKPDTRFASARDVASELRRVQQTLGTVAARRRLTPVVVVGALVLLGAGLWLGGSLRQGARIQQAKATIPRILALADSGNAEGAWSLTQEVQSVLGDDPQLESVWPKFSRLVNVHTDPPGVRLLRRPFAGSDTTWRALGVTPLDGVRVPIGGWYLRLEKDGFTPREVLVSVSIVSSTNLDYALDADRRPATDMVRVQGGLMPELNLPGLEGLGGVTLDGFSIDAHEVTNERFKQFVDAGGYRRPELWDQTFILDGRTLTRTEAMARFTDRSGRPGPATWEAGDYPAGQGNYPVSGVSWYEAAAYAKFAGKSLPTIFHWVRAARTTASVFIVPRSNFDGHGGAPVGAYRGIGPYGTVDMAGNVREWCLNAAGSAAREGARYILGGGWNDPGYAFTDGYAQPPFDRSPTNGFRLARYQDEDTTLAYLGRPVLGAPIRDFTRERPASDAMFAAYRRQYDYDRSPLDPTVEGRDTTAEDYVVERVTFAAAYGGERVRAYLFMPKRARPPYQTVVFFPGSNGLNLRTFDPAPWVRTFDFMLKSGRAVLMPIYKSTFERGDGFETDITDETNAYREHVVMWVKDFRRSVDYLATRADVDTSRLAYYGISWGGVMGGIIPAVEPRIRVVILTVAGLSRQRGLPEVEPINFLPRITQPVLMLNGRFDHYFPVETSQKPFFRLLGTPPADKRQVIADGGHSVPRNQVIGEALDWLDHYLGPVR